MIKALIRYCQVVIALVLFLSSCTKEDLSMCDVNTTIRFSYAYAPFDTTGKEFPNLLRVVRLFVFDNNTQRFITEIERSVPEEFAHKSFVMEFDLEPGTYSLVAWSGDRNIQLGIATSDNDEVKLGAFVAGVTTIDQALMMFNETTPPEGALLPAVINSDSLNLYHGKVQNVEIVRGRDNHAEIAFVLSSHDILVRVKDYRAVKPDVKSCDVSATLVNNMLTFDNNHPSTVQTVSYLPHLIYDEEFNVRSSIMSVLRMSPDMVGDLVLKDSRTDRELFRRSLVREIIARHPIVQLNPVANLEKYPVYEIEIILTDGKPIISITIENWKVRIVDIDV